MQCITIWKLPSVGILRKNGIMHEFIYLNVSSVGLMERTRGFLLLSYFMQINDTFAFEIPTPKRCRLLLIIVQWTLYGLYIYGINTPINKKEILYSNKECHE